MHGGHALHVRGGGAARVALAGSRSPERAQPVRFPRLGHSTLPRSRKIVPSQIPRWHAPAVALSGCTVPVRGGRRGGPRGEEPQLSRGRRDRRAEARANSRQKGVSAGRRRPRSVGTVGSCRMGRGRGKPRLAWTVGTVGTVGGPRRPRGALWGYIWGYLYACGLLKPPICMALGRLCGAGCGRHSVAVPRAPSPRRGKDRESVARV